jgi:GTPase SAR1 family protein
MYLGKSEPISKKDVIKVIEYFILRSLSPTFKMSIMGDTSVGIKTFMKNYFSNIPLGIEISVIGWDYGIKIVKYLGLKIKLQLWSISSKGKDKSLIKFYLRGASLILYLYDITNDKSLNLIPELFNNISSRDLPLVLAGNKCDLDYERKVPIKYGIEIAKKYDFNLFMELSILNDEMVENLFRKISELLIRKVY